MKITNTYFPTVIEKEGRGEKGYDVISRLLKDRIIFLNGEIDDNTAGSIVAQLLFLEAEAPEEDIYMYINSPGGVITSGMSIYDTMNFISCDVRTICIGQACSMGSFLLSSGAPGKRFALPHARIMIHQPLGGAQGQASDILIQAKEILRMKEELNSIYAKNSKGKTSYEKFTELTDRDNFLSAQESIDLGLIDHILVKR